MANLAGPISGIDKLNLVDVFPSVRDEIDRENKPIEATRKTNYIVLTLLDLLVVCGVIYLIGTGGVFSNTPINWTFLGLGIGLAAIAVISTAIALQNIHLKANNEIERINHARQPMEYTEFIKQVGENRLDLSKLCLVVNGLTERDFIRLGEAVTSFCDDTLNERIKNPRLTQEMLQAIAEQIPRALNQKLVDKIQDVALLRRMVEDKNSPLHGIISANTAIRIMGSCMGCSCVITIRRDAHKEFIDKNPRLNFLQILLKKLFAVDLSQGLADKIQGVTLLKMVVAEENSPLREIISANIPIMGPRVITLMSRDALKELIEKELIEKMIQESCEELIEVAPKFLSQDSIDIIQDVALLRRSVGKEHSHFSFKNKISPGVAIRIMHSMGKGRFSFSVVRNVSKCMSPEAFNEFFENRKKCGLTEEIIDAIEDVAKKREQLSKDCG